MAEDQILLEVRKMIAEIAETDEAKITGDAKLVEDLGLDSMLSLEVLAAVEKKYKIQIPEDKMADMNSLNNVTAIVKSFLPQG